MMHIHTHTVMYTQQQLKFLNQKKNREIHLKLKDWTLLREENKIHFFFLSLSASLVRYSREC